MSAYQKKETPSMPVASPPPNNIETEQIVLGALILEKDAYAIVSEILSPDCFYEPKNRYIFEAIRDLAIKERPIDTMTVIEQLKQNKTLKKAGSELYIATIASQINSTAHLEVHARILYDKAMQRNLISFGNNVIKNAYDDSIDVADTLQDAESKLFEISQKSTKDEVQPVKDLVDKAIKSIENAQSIKDGLRGIPTGFVELNEKTAGWQPSDLVIIAARPAMGKTAFVLSMAKSIAMDYGHPVAIFSLEMSKAQLMNRIIVNVLRIPNEDIKRGTLDAEQMRKITNGLEPLSNSPLYLDDNAALTIFDLRSKARRLVREHDCKLIIIDYLQLMTASGLNAKANREQEVSTISRSLKCLAKELDITIIALSQLNRSVESRTGDGKKPQLSDLRESGAIEQDADMVCFIHRPEYYGITEDPNFPNRDLKGLAEFIIAKHRNGPTGSILLKFESEFISFSSALDHPIRDTEPNYTTKRSAINDINYEKENILDEI